MIRAAAGRLPGRGTRSSIARRWSVVPSSSADTPAPREPAVDARARSLLHRYGVVFRRLLAREANAAPWRELTRVFRRLEARGEIRGGRLGLGRGGGAC